jgi:uncharacterized delta-60 repeat protein
MVGDKDSSFVLERHLADGSLDTTFGGGGLVSTPVGTGYPTEARAVVAHPDGKLTVGGYALIQNEGFVFALVQYNPDGSLDPGFGVAGIALTKIRSPAEVHALVRQPDGKLVAAGGAPGDTGHHRFTLARYRPDGSLDPTFGPGGIVQARFGTGLGAEARDLILQPDGKLIAAGYEYGVEDSPVHFGYTSHFAVVRYLPDGSLDPSFGSGGLVVTRIGASNASSASSLALQPDGKIIAVGSAPDGRDPTGWPIIRWGLARYQGDEVDAPASAAPRSREQVTVATIRRLRVVPSRFRAASKGPAALPARRRSRKYGATAYFSLNVSGRVSFRIKRIVRARCSRDASAETASRARRRCQRQVAVRGSFRRVAHVGSNRFRLTGRLAGRRLRPSAYRLLATPSADGRRGKVVSASFRIVR